MGHVNIIPVSLQLFSSHKIVMSPNTQCYKNYQSIYYFYLAMVKQLVYIYILCYRLCITINLHVQILLNKIQQIITIYHCINFPLQMNIAIFGDSLVAGWSPDAHKLIKKNQTWPYLLKSSIPNSQVFVDGQPGRMLSNPLQPKADLNYFRDFVEKSTLQNYSLLILMIGANDLPVKSAPEIIHTINEYLKTFQGNKLFVLHPGIQYQTPKCFHNLKTFRKLKRNSKC
ncbi:GDSL-like_Lipase/Acylhydrolase family protein [Hexamita inflata]|uniref:GDSL-like_Lipase/Acylhydrolase family protein n=1 Tax=Hexamita inflata TaxID=28002 RepID=A0ABP1LSG8_9EUKA